MALLTDSLRKHVAQASRQDVRAYAALLLGNQGDADSLNKLAMLALRLGKSSDDIIQDRKAMLRAAELRDVIAVGRNNVEALDAARTELRTHQKATEQMIAQRKAEEEAFRTRLGGALSVQNAAEDAITELNKLRAQYDDVLSDEPAPDASALQPK